MPWAKHETAEFTAWLTSLSEEDQDSVTAAIQELLERGPGLGRPYVDTLSNTRVHNPKELRPITQGPRNLRVIFAFDPLRSAVLLIGGDKTGNWQGWYKTNIPLAENLYHTHLERLSLKKEEEMRATGATTGHSKVSKPGKTSRRRKRP